MRVAVSIIICTRNREKSLRETLTSIGQCEIPPSMVAEVLVVDNGSTDQTQRVVAQTSLPNMPLRTVIEGRKGKGYAYNTGLAQATGDVLLFTDDDVRVGRDWVVAMCTPIAEGVADALQGAIVAAPYLRRPWLRGIYADAIALTGAVSGVSPPTLVGANMAFGRHVLAKVPGFKLELGPGAAGLADDTLFGLELNRAGYRLAYADGGEVEHHFDALRLERASFFRWARMSGLSTAIMDTKWLGRQPKHPRLLWAWTIVKYGIRRVVDPRTRPVPPEWVLWYRWRMAYALACARLSREI